MGVFDSRLTFGSFNSVFQLILKSQSIIQGGIEYPSNRGHLEQASNSDNSVTMMGPMYWAQAEFL